MTTLRVIRVYKVRLSNDASLLLVCMPSVENLLILERIRIGDVGFTEDAPPGAPLLSQTRIKDKKRKGDHCAMALKMEESTKVEA